MLCIKVKVNAYWHGSLREHFSCRYCLLPGNSSGKLSFGKYSYEAIYVKWQIFYAMKLKQGVFPAFVILFLFS